MQSIDSSFDGNFSGNNNFNATNSYVLNNNRNDITAKLPINPLEISWHNNSDQQLNSN